MVIFFHIFLHRNKINIFDKNIINELKRRKVDKLIIKRKRNILQQPIKEVAIDMKYFGNAVLQMDDYIEVIGIINKKEHLIYITGNGWKEDEKEQIKKIVFEYNNISEINRDK
jgi:hypothetical protein